MTPTERAAFDQMRAALEEYTDWDHVELELNSLKRQALIALTQAKEVQAQVVTEGGNHLPPTPQAQRLSDAEINETYRQRRITFSVPDDCDRYPSTWMNTDSLDKLSRAIETAFAAKNGIHLGD